MIEIRKKLKMNAAAYRVQTKGTMELPFEERCKSRAQVKLTSGEEVALRLPRGEILRGGDMVVASDGRIIEVLAAKESVVEVKYGSAAQLARAAFHLGNRHVPVQIGDGWLRFAGDHVLEDMLRGLGASLSTLQAPFEPEEGAYAGHDHEGHGGVIHDFGEHADEHGHVHGPNCGHDHSGHGHAHGHDHGHDHDHDHGHGHGHDHGHSHKHGHDHAHDHAPAKKQAHDHDHDHDHDHGHDHGHAHKGHGHKH